MRLVRPIAGTPRITIEFAPRPDYGRALGTMIATAHGVEVLDAGAPLHLYSNVIIAAAMTIGALMDVRDGRVRAWV